MLQGRSEAFRRWSWLTVLALSSGAAIALASVVAGDTGWQALIVLWGGGESAAAVRETARVTRALGVALHHTELDDTTQDFLDDSLEALKDFNLGDFYDRLPEKNGDFRELWVRGDLDGDKYVVRESENPGADRVSLAGPRRALGASSLTVRAKEVKSRGKDEAFFFAFRFGLGVGALRWDRAVSALTHSGRLLTTGDPRAGGGAVIEAGASAAKQARALHPGLDDEDAAVLALLFESFPNLSTTLSRLGRVEDLRTVGHDRGYQELHIALRGLPDRFKQHYPALSKHLARLDRIAHIETRWLDRQGRTLGEFKVDSDTLTVSARLHLRDGKLVPWRGATVFDDEPLDPFSPELANTTFVSDVQFQFLGVMVKLDQLTLEASYKPQPGSADMGVRFTRVPKQIHVEGAALGFVPTKLVDAMIPGNMEGITRDFLTVAAKGNGGRGVVASLNLGSAEQGARDGVVDAAIEFDALDNFLVTIALGMVNERVIPDDRAIEDAKRFHIDLHAAFVRDFDRFVDRCQCGAPVQSSARGAAKAGRSR